MKYLLMCLIVLQVFLIIAGIVYLHQEDISKGLFLVIFNGVFIILNIYTLINWRDW